MAEKESTRHAGPTDFLREWIRSGTLLSLILDAGQTLEWPESELELAASSGYAFRRLVLLTVVTYCYSIGVYGSKKIALKCSQDEVLRFLCAGTFSTTQDIRDFTQHNLDLIKRCLIRAYQLAHEFEPQTGTGSPANCPREKLLGLDDQTQPDLELQFATTVESWIRRAEESDALASND